MTAGMRARVAVDDPDVRPAAPAPGVAMVVVVAVAVAAAPVPPRRHLLVVVARLLVRHPLLRARPADQPDDQQEARDGPDHDARDLPARQLLVRVPALRADDRDRRGRLPPLDGRGDVVAHGAGREDQGVQEVGEWL